MNNPFRKNKFACTICHTSQDVPMGSLNRWLDPANRAKTIDISAFSAACEELDALHDDPTDVKDMIDSNHILHFQDGIVPTVHKVFTSKLIQVFTCECSPCAMDAHTHEVYEVIQVLKGTLIVSMETDDDEESFEHYTLKAGDACMIPPNTQHSCGWLTGAKMLVMMLPPDVYYATLME